MGMKTTKTTKKEDENENEEEEEGVSRIRFELCWWIKEEHCGGPLQKNLHAEIEKRLKEYEALSNRAMKKLSEKQRIIQEQAKLIKEKENESITDATSAKDKAILAAAESLSRKRGLMQRWLKGLMILRRYQLKLQMTSLE